MSTSATQGSHNNFTINIFAICLLSIRKHTSLGIKRNVIVDGLFKVIGSNICCKCGKILEMAQDSNICCKRGKILEMAQDTL